ncbi:MAG: ABC transporter substrate-binding protein [Janthinobacterium lividum]
MRIPPVNLLQKTAALLLLSLPGALQLTAQTSKSGGEIAWAIGYDPKTLDPAKADDQAAETVRYLTGGVLLRLNRSTLQLEPALADKWSISADGRIVSFHLRPGLRFSDGSALTSADVAATLRRVLTPATAAPVADEFLVQAKVTVDTPDPALVRVHLPQRIVSIGAIFDEIAIEPANRPSEGRVTAGSFVISEYHRGDSLRLTRNPFYWKHDASGAALPYLASVRLDMLSNRETEELRFARGQYALVDLVLPEGFDALNHRAPGTVHDLGASLNTEQMWFNQSSSAPLPAWEKAWFSNRAFRQAVSQAIHRADLARIAYAGHATPANGFISPANTTWYNHALAPVQENPGAALQLLTAAGFHKQGNVLMDHEGHPIRFSILTNADNRSRQRMAALIQQDLAVLGMQVNLVTLDFPALIEKLMHTGDYEAALLGLSDVQPDPSSMMNVWLSSSPNHQWNPAEKQPATAWEAEIDRLMRTQAEAGDFKARKAAIDQVQTIVAEEQPFTYLVYPNVLCAASPALQDLRLTILQPAVLSGIDTVYLKAGSR